MDGSQNLVIEEKLKSILCISTSNSMVPVIKNEIDFIASQNLDHIHSQDDRKHLTSHSSEKKLLNQSNITNSTVHKYSHKRRRNKPENYNYENKFKSSNFKDTNKLNDSLLEENSAAILNEQNILDNNPKSKHNIHLMNDNQFQILNSKQNKLDESKKIQLTKIAFKELSVNNESQTRFYNSKKTDDNKYDDKINKSITKNENIFGIDNSDILKGDNVFHDDNTFGVNLNSSKLNETPEKVEKQFENQKKDDDHNEPLQNNAEKQLEKHGMFPLKKKNPRFPNAKYFCRICNYHLDNIGFCFRHSKESTHMHHFNAKKKKVPTATLR